VRRALTRNAKGELELAYYLCCAPAGITDEDLIRVAGSRWVEECFATAKTETGLDQYQVRRYDAWYRHITLAILAHAYLSVTAATARKPWQRPHPGHVRRGPPSPGTPDHHSPQPNRRVGLVPLAPVPPVLRQDQPLPAKTGPISRSAAVILIDQLALVGDVDLFESQPGEVIVPPLLPDGADRQRARAILGDNNCLIPVFRRHRHDPHEYELSRIVCLIVIPDLNQPRVRD